MKIFLVIYILLNSYILCAQENLILNNSFENILDVPCSLGQYEKCFDVWNPNNTSVDLFCSMSDSFCLNSVPNNTFGNQSSIDANNYIGIGLFTYNYNLHLFNLPYHDFHGGIFKEKLISNKIYQFQFHMSRAENCEISSNALDVVITKDTLIDIEEIQGYGYKVWSMQEIFQDTISWVKISLCFKAFGGENSFVIGNFHDTLDIQMTYPQTQNQGKACSYIYLDNFSIYECPTCCPDQFPNQEQVYVYSNPSSENSPANIAVWLLPETTATLSVYDSAGRLVAEEVFTKLQNNFIFDHFAAGLYHFIVRSSDGLDEMGKVLVSY